MQHEDPNKPGDIWASQLDVFAFLDTIEDGTMDGCLTDVPYPTTERYRMIGTTTRTKESTKSSNPWYGIMSIEEISRFLDALYPKLKPNAYAFVYVDDATMKLLERHRGVHDELARLNDIAKLRDGTLKPTSQAPRDHVGFAWWDAFTWVKVAQEDDGDEPDEETKLAPGNGFHGKKCTERILCLEKGKSQLRVSLNNAQLACRPPAPKGATIKKRGSPKPTIIAERLARAMSAPGGTIVDPFVGSGTHALGITRTGNHAVCNDVDLEHFRDWIAASGRTWEAW